MARPTNPLTAALAFLAPLMPGTVVSAPRGEWPVPRQGEVAPRYCLVQAVPGGQRPSDAQLISSYTIRCLGVDHAAALAAWDELAAALQRDTGEPVGPLPVSLTAGSPPTTRSWWLYRAELGGMAGPELDPETRWPTIATTATIEWGSTEL